jgi:hypothetical protein
MRDGHVMAFVGEGMVHLHGTRRYLDDMMDGHLSVTEVED